MELTGATCLKARLRHTLKGAGMPIFTVSDVDLLDNIYDLLDTPGRSQTHIQARVLDLKYKLVRFIADQKTKDNPGMLVHISKLLDSVDASITRRHMIMRVAKHNPCPKCKMNQVELIGSVKIGRWKCRCCKHKWVWEPITLIRSDSN